MLAQIRYEKIFEKNLCTTLKMQGGGLKRSRGFGFGAENLYGFDGAGGKAAASGCCMVDTGAGPELRLRSGQGQARSW